MEQYKRYLEELHPGKSVYSDERGFAVYWIRGEECYIEDIYVEREHRKSRGSHALADAVAKLAHEKDCKYMTGSVVPSANGATLSLKMMLSYGFKVHSAENNLILFIKEL